MSVRRLLLPAILGCTLLGLAAPTSATPPSTSLVGVWERVTHCQDYVRALMVHRDGDTLSLASLDEFGNQVDEGTYEIIDGTLVMPYGFEEGPPILVTFHYRIHGNTIVFDPVIPSDCSTSRCREAAAWSIAVALPGKTWRRVG